MIQDFFGILVFNVLGGVGLIGSELHRSRLVDLVDHSFRDKGIVPGVGELNEIEIMEVLGGDQTSHDKFYNHFR